MSPQISSIPFFKNKINKPQIVASHLILFFFIICPIKYIFRMLSIKFTLCVLILFSVKLRPKYFSEVGKRDCG